MKVYKGKKLVCEGRVAKNLLTKAWGWMLHKPKKKEGLLFEFRDNYKPMMWMFMTISDINMAFLDKNYKVVDFQRASSSPLKWLKIHSPRKPCKYVLELHPSNKLKIGDKLRIV